MLGLIGCRAGQLCWLAGGRARQIPPHRHQRRPGRRDARRHIRRREVANTPQVLARLPGPARLARVRDGTSPRGRRIHRRAECRRALRALNECSQRRRPLLVSLYRPARPGSRGEGQRGVRGKRECIRRLRRWRPLRRSMRGQQGGGAPAACGAARPAEGCSRRGHERSPMDRQAAPRPVPRPRAQAAPQACPRRSRAPRLSGGAARRGRDRQANKGSASIRRRGTERVREGYAGPVISHFYPATYEHTRAMA